MSSGLTPYENDKANFFNELEKLRPDLMYPEIFQEKDTDTVDMVERKKEAVSNFRSAKMKTGMIASIPMRCYGERCAFAESCFLLKQNLHPEGSPCPIEMAAVKQFFEDYVNELEVDVTKMVEVSLVRDLVDQEIQQMRKTWLLSQEHFIQENVVGTDQEGNIVTRKELHQAIDYEDRILRRKEKLRNALLATREAKAKTGQERRDNAQVVSDLMNKVRDIELQRQKDLKKELGLELTDEYVEAEILKEEGDDS